MIEGIRDGDWVRVLAIHPARNLAAAPDHFEIDPLEQFRLMRALRGTDREIVGCYHSHPNGRAEPSKRDLECAIEDGFVWLIAALDSDAEPLRAFVNRKAEFAEIPLLPASQC